MIKVAITDDHLLVLKGLQTLLEDIQNIEVVGAYKNGEETLSKIKNDSPDILLLDINLPDIDGISICKILSKDYKNLNIIALSNSDDTSTINRMLMAGAKGYLLKNTDRIELLSAFKIVKSGETYIQMDLKSKLKKTNKVSKKLTRREKEILLAVSQEFTTLEIAKKFNISPKTVESHRMNLMVKFDVKNSIGLIKRAIEEGYL